MPKRADGSRGANGAPERADVVVIGGGASGMAAAIMCARSRRRVIVLEHNRRLARKLLATGNGKCNYTNKRQDLDCYHGTDKGAIRESLGEFGLADTLSFFCGLGVYPRERNGCCYPYSERAASVADAMGQELSHLGVIVRQGEHAKSVERTREGFAVTATRGRYLARKVVVATGGLASPIHGSDGSGYAIAEAFGHSIAPLSPALCGLRTGEDFSPMAGVRARGKVSVFVSGRDGERKEDTGELQLASYGISGIPTFQVSRHAAIWLLAGEDVRGALDFFPDLSLESLSRMALRIREDCRYKTAGALFQGILDGKISDRIWELLRIGRGREALGLSEGEIRKFCRLAKDFPCSIVGTCGFESAQVTAGGVRLSEVDPRTMESRLAKGLYFAGELLDVDGICGGYNLQWAWTSGCLAGRAAGRR